MFTKYVDNTKLQRTNYLLGVKNCYPLSFIQIRFALPFVYEPGLTYY